jgi:hypothetical protein
VVSRMRVMRKTGAGQIGVNDPPQTSASNSYKVIPPVSHEDFGENS